MSAQSPERWNHWILLVLVGLLLFGCSEGKRESPQAPGLIRLFDLLDRSDTRISTELVCLREEITNQWEFAGGNSQTERYSYRLGFCPSSDGWGMLELAGDELPRKPEPLLDDVREVAWGIYFGQPNYPLGKDAKAVWVERGRPMVLQVNPLPSSSKPSIALLRLKVRGKRNANTYPKMLVLVDGQIIHESVISHSENRVHTVPIMLGNAPVELKIESDSHVISYPVTGHLDKRVGVVVQEVRLENSPVVNLYVPAEKAEWARANLVPATCELTWLQADDRPLSSLEEPFLAPPNPDSRKRCLQHLLGDNVQVGAISLQGLIMRKPSVFAFPVDFVPGSTVMFSLGLSADIGNAIFMRVSARIGQPEENRVVLDEQLITQPLLDPEPLVRHFSITVPEQVKGKGTIEFRFSNTPRVPQVNAEIESPVPDATYLFGAPMFVLPSAKDQATVPSAILVSIDTLRGDHLSCYGYPFQTSPNMDDFAKKNLRFPIALSPSNWTLPSHRAFLNGLAVGQQEAFVENRKVILNVANLAQKLRQMGYLTVAFTDGGYVSADYGMDLGFDLFDGRGGRLKQIYPRLQSWLEAFGSQAPFFLFFHFFDVHTPYGCSETNLERFFDECGCEMDPELVAQINSEDFHPKENNIHIDQKMRHHLVHLYDADIHYSDDYIGQMLSLLRRLRLYDEMTVIITSDHGEEFGEHGGWDHGRELYAELVNVPLIVKFPSSHELKGVIDVPVSLMDVAPTLVALAGGQPPEAWYGSSLLDIVNNPQEFENRRVISEFLGGAFGREIYKFAIQDPGAKYIRTFCRRGSKIPDPNWGYYTGEQDQLYFTKLDPGERADLAAFYPGLAEHYRTEVQNRLNQFKNANVAQIDHKEIEVSQEVLDTLKNLGYIQ